MGRLTVLTVPTVSPPVTLRPYQQTAVNQLRAAVTAHGSAVYQAATGSGKTVIAGEVARLGAERGNPSLLLVHRRELVAQAVDTLSEFCPGLSVGVVAAGWPATPWADLYVGMVQSIHRRKQLPMLSDPVIVIVDEAHHARAKTWERVLARWPRAFRVGLTATPERLDGKGLGEHFAAMVAGPSIRQLVADGWLAPTRALTLPPNVTFTRRRADLDAQVSAKIVADAADAYHRYAAGRRALFFGINRAHSKRVAGSLRERGWRARHVDATTPSPERDRIMTQFREGDLDVVCNVDLVSEGFDAPACEVVMMGRPTKSVTMFLQQAGRAMRPSPGKTALVLDLAGNVAELGLPDERREWSLADGEISDRRTGRAKPRPCSSCRTAFYGSTCPHCGLVRAAKQRVRQEVVELVDATARRRITRRRGKLSRPELNRLLARARRSPDPRAALEAIVADHGYKPAFVHYILRAWGVDQ